MEISKYCAYNCIPSLTTRDINDCLAVLAMDVPSNVKECPDCGRLVNKSNFARHRKALHPELKVEGKNVCLEFNCNFSSPFSAALRCHLRDVHSIPMSEKFLTFSNLSTFEDWKTDFESSTTAKFVKMRASKNGISFYQCSRSADYNKSTNNGKKFKTSKKVSSACTAGLRVEVKDTGSVLVACCETHYGHEQLPGCLPLNYHDKMKIAGKIVMGVSDRRIIDDIRDDFPASNKVEPIHFVGAQELRNIKKQFKLNSGRRDDNDATSVKLLVEEAAHGPDNPYVFYKEQGEEPQPEDIDLKKEDCLIIIQRNIQRQLMVQLGHRSRICFDSTHKTNAYDFYLNTILVVDEYGQGIPVAFVISNREDRGMLKIAFEKLKKTLSDDVPFEPAYIMSDDAEQYFNAWLDVFGPGPVKLLCTWHVDRAWRKTVHDKISDTEVRDSIFKMLTTIREETEPEKFEQMLTEFLSTLEASSGTAAFLEHFQRTYANRPKQWAACYRRGAGINTNMFLESFHKLLKDFYMGGKFNKRVDTCINVLLKVTRDIAFDRLMKSQKGKTTSRLSELRRRHDESTKISTDNVQETEKDKSWRVKATDGDKSYEVTTSECTIAGCQLQCIPCGVCAHMFNCKCYDNQIRDNMCKHIHLVCRSRSTTGSTVLSTNRPGTRVICDVQLVRSAASKPSRSQGPSSELRTKAESLVQRASALVNELKTDEELQALIDGLKQTMTRVDVIKNAKIPEPYVPTEEDARAPGNKNNEHQRRFFSTKKRRKTTRVRLAKPSTAEQDDIIEKLTTGQGVTFIMQQLEKASDTVVTSDDSSWKG